MSWTPPTVAEFKAQFFRDFPYAPPEVPATDYNYIQDQDITNAINMALMDFNSCLFGDNTTLIFMWLAAYYLVEVIRTSSAGLGSLAKFALNSSTVGGVSISNNIPSKYADDPNFAKYLTNNYGKIYVDLVYPYTIGAGIRVAFGTTTSA